MRTDTCLAGVAAALFDLDGTLVDTAEDFVQILNQMRAKYGLPDLPPGTIRNTVSDGARALTRLGFGGQEGETLFERRRSELLERYELEVGKHACLFKGMSDTLEHLEQKNILWGIVTNKPRRYSETLLQQLDLQNRCAVLVCPDDVSEAKPSPEGLFLAAKQLAQTSDTTIYIGDHERDILAGKAAGMRTVAAKYGYLADPESAHRWQADLVIESASDLQHFL